MKHYLDKEDIHYSSVTIHAYMKELHLKSIVRPKKPAYIKGKAHKIFPNLLNRDFNVNVPNRKWVTDFTYMQLKDGTKRYNCTIIDLYDRSAVATLNASTIDARLAIETLSLALKNQSPKPGLILHSDQGVQYTSKVFNDFCEDNSIQQSMSRAGCPYDNAPMERFYNTFKNEHYCHHDFRSIESLDESTQKFIMVHYNCDRPHTYNGGKPPLQARVLVNC